MDKLPQEKKGVWVIHEFPGKSFWSGLRGQIRLEVNLVLKVFQLRCHTQKDNNNNNSNPTVTSSVLITCTMSA